MRLEKIWAREYANGVHFSTVKKDGFTAYVPEKLALAIFLRAQLALVEDRTEQVLGANDLLDRQLVAAVTKYRRRKQNNKRKRRT